MNNRLTKAHKTCKLWKKGGGFMYLKRKIDEYLLEWKKNEERLPLIIKGARQIGKTESINHFYRTKLQ